MLVATTLVALVSAFVVVVNPLHAAAVEIEDALDGDTSSSSGVTHGVTSIADINLGTAASFSSVSEGALTVGAGASVAGGVAVGDGAAATVDPSAAVGAAVAGITQAQADVQAAYLDAQSRTPTGALSATIAGQTFVSGVYYSGGAVASTGTVTLDAQGNEDAVFIFQIDAALNTAAKTSMVLINGAQARHVYWQVNGAVTMGAGATFVGTILASGAVTAGAEAKISGRTFAQGAVTLGAGMETLGVPQISLTNDASPTGIIFDGETITYTLVATNSGNVALTVDPLSMSGVDAISALSYDWSGTSGTLLPKESVTVTGSYVATFADAVLRSVTASAGVGGLSHPNGVSGGDAEKVLVIAVRIKTVTVWPIPVVDSVTVTQGVATTFDVLTNDQTLPTGVKFSRIQLTDEPRALGQADAVTPRTPVHGSVTCASDEETRGMCTYRSSALFSGTDGFDYSVSQLGRSWNVHVAVTVESALAAPVTRSVRVTATTGGPTVTIRPLANDDVGTAGASGGRGNLVITSTETISSEQGRLTCSSITCSFVPPTSGYIGTVVAQYETAEDLGQGVFGPTSSASITIFVDPVALTNQGFTAAHHILPSVTAGEWQESTVMEPPTTLCVARRPQVSLTWSPNVMATSWTVERRHLPPAAEVTAGSSEAVPTTEVPNEAWVAIAILPGSASSFRDTRLGGSNEFQWRVRPDLNRWEGVFSDASVPTTTPDPANAVGC